MYEELLIRNGELLAWFKAACTLAIVLGTGFGACFALWRHAEKDNEKLQDCLDEAHREADKAQQGHLIALATLAEERQRP